ncbi:unnamed protein product [marine sediment metagenome]|uniref:Uncharacterized protein n=1 Tax=marine sediment metagenome TaxID=412755 RepID=X1AFU4_9ZZZZ
MEIPNSIRKNFLLIIILLIVSIAIRGLLLEKRKLETQIDRIQTKVDSKVGSLEKEKIALEQALVDKLQSKVDNLRKEKIVLEQALVDKLQSKVDNLRKEKIVLGQELAQTKQKAAKLAETMAQEAAKAKMDKTGFPSAELWIDKERIIYRTGVKNDNNGLLHWVITYNGIVALKRNARGGTQYKYFRKDPGVYTVYLEQFVDGQYRVISNVVSYRIPYP